MSDAMNTPHGAALTFLRTLLAPESAYYSASEKGPGGFRNHPVSSIEELAAKSFATSDAGRDAYFGLSGFAQAKVIDEAGKSTFRTQDNAIAQMCLWEDVDVGDGPNKYPDAQTALQALTDFIRDTGLVQPTVVASGGGGVHFYLPFTEQVSTERWLRMAVQLKELAARYGFRIDPSRATDAASVLRVPGTRNYKYAPPRDVTLLHLSSPTPVEELEALLSKALQNAPPLPTPTGKATKNPATQPVPPSLLTPENIFGLHPYVAAALKHASYSIASAEPGTRNAVLFKNVAALAGFIPTGYIEEETLRAEAEAAFLQCHPNDYDPKEFEATFTSAIKSGKSSPREIPPPLPPGYSLIKSGPDTGLWYTPPTKDENDQPTKIRLGAPIEVLELVRDGSSKGWGRRVRWYDPDGVMHCRVIPDELLAGNDSTKWLSILANGGWILQGGGRNGVELLKRFLTNCQPTRRLLCIARTGWTDDCLTFVLPDKVIPETQSDSIILHPQPSRNPYSQGGIFEEWKNTIGTWCSGNSRFLFALCMAFAGVLLKLFEQESGGANFYGQSSGGKSTIAFASASVWGKGTMGDGFVQTWRTTDNALENTCMTYSDTLLVLDELGQASEKVLGGIAYMISGGQGKDRAKSDASARSKKTWTVFTLSTGELTLADKLMEDGKKTQAGQAVRLLDIPADAGTGYGCFENLHGFPSAAAFADAVKSAAATHYGHAGPLFIEKLIENADAVKMMAKEIPALAEKLCGIGAAGQVKRAANRFALVAVAGLLAVRFGILPVSEQEVGSAVKKCFEAWLDARGGKDALEELQLLERVKQFLETHGASRFENLDYSPVPGIAICHNRAGFKSAKSGRTNYYITDAAFKKEICQGMSQKTAEGILVRAGFLIKDGAHLKCKLPKDHPEVGRKRHYKLCLPDTGPVMPVPIPPPGWVPPVQANPIVQGTSGCPTAPPNPAGLPMP